MVIKKTPNIHEMILVYVPIMLQSLIYILLTTFLQENASFYAQVHRSEHQYAYRTTDGTPVSYKSKVEVQRYTGRHQRCTGKGPVNSLSKMHATVYR